MTDETAQPDNWNPNTMGPDCDWCGECVWCDPYGKDKDKD